MEKSDVDKEAELLRQIAGDVAMIKVDAGDGNEGAVVRRRSAENAFVGTNIRSDPITGVVTGIGEDRLLPGLKRNVGVALAVVGEYKRRIDGHLLSAVAELVLVVKQLAAADELDLGVRKSAMADGIDSLGCGGEEEEEEA